MILKCKHIGRDRLCRPRLECCLKSSLEECLIRVLNVCGGGILVLSLSVIPSFCDHFFYRFCSVTFVALARFCSNFHHTLTIRHCMFCKKIGAEGSVLQELCHFVILNAINFLKGFAL